MKKTPIKYRSGFTTFEGGDSNDLVKVIVVKWICYIVAITVIAFILKYNPQAIAAMKFVAHLP